MTRRRHFKRSPAGAFGKKPTHGTELSVDRKIGGAIGKLIKQRKQEQRKQDKRMAQLKKISKTKLTLAEELELIKLNLIKYQKLLGDTSKGVVTLNLAGIGKKRNLSEKQLKQISKLLYEGNIEEIRNYKIETLTEKKSTQLKTIIKKYPAKLIPKPKSFTHLPSGNMLARISVELKIIKPRKQVQQVNKYGSRIGKPKQITEEIETTSTELLVEYNLNSLPSRKKKGNLRIQTIDGKGKVGLIPDSVVSIVSQIRQMHEGKTGTTLFLQGTLTKAN